MRSGPAYLSSLGRLHEITEESERVATWRQGMAALAAAAAAREPAPLEGISPAALLASVRAAIEGGLVDDVSFLAPAAGGLALFELASALPPAPEKRELGHLVLARLQDGDGPTFVALATALAQSSRRALGAVRARVALALSAPIGAGTGVDGLALALVSRRDLEREWLVVPSVGSLSSRRMAARLLERAAREAVRRLAEGDESGAMVFHRAALRDTWRRLLADRESLVWRHVAAARGLLADVLPALGDGPALGDEIEAGLALTAGPTEWRRSATSLAAGLATAPGRGVERLREVIRSELVQRDAGVAGALVAGLASAFVVEPETADLIAAEAIELGGVPAVEALAELRRELGDLSASWAMKAAGVHIEMELARPGLEEGQAALLLALRAELGGAAPAAGAGQGDDSLWPIAAALRQGRRRAVEGDFEAARSDVLAALRAADAAVEWLERSSDEVASDRQGGFRALRELDHCLLEQDVARDLLSGASDVIDRGPELDALEARLEAWLLAREVALHARPPHPALRLQRLRVLVHLVDREAGDAPATCERRSASFRVLLTRARSERSELRRVVWAALARACDALVRDEVVEFSDVLLALTSELADEDADGLAIVQQASMLPDLSRVLGEYGAAMASARRAASGGGTAVRVEAVGHLAALARALPLAESTRLEAVRVALLRVAGALRRLAAPEAASAVEAIDLLARGVGGLAQLAVGARRRFGLAVVEVGAAAALQELGLALRRGEVRIGLNARLETAARALAAELPPPVALVTGAVLRAAVGSLTGRAVTAPRLAIVAAVSAAPLAVAQGDPTVPAWLPPGRTIGGFHVLRKIAAGAGGSVLLATRAEDRHGAAPELFALKVPDYDGGAARSLSEDEFNLLFREEAVALLSLPPHPNLSGFVTFDARARPKPILVMELVPGPSLEDVLDERALDTAAAFALLGGVAAGLAAMHEARVAHLDVKPANIILRSGAGAPTPVLVDFGLAGRRLRPGCGSPHYGAPEVWSTSHARGATAEAADVYAFACLAYEVLFGAVLVTGDSPLAVVAVHIAGKAGKAELGALARDRALKPLARCLQAALDRDHRDRPSMAALRADLGRLAPALAERRWPLAAGG